MAGRGDPLGRPRDGEDEPDVDRPAEPRQPQLDGIVDRIERRASDERRQQIDPDRPVADRDVVDDPEVDDRDRRDLRVADVGQRRMDGVDRRPSALRSPGRLGIEPADGRELAMQPRERLAVRRPSPVRVAGRGQRWQVETTERRARAARATAPRARPNDSARKASSRSPRSLGSGVSTVPASGPSCSSAASSRSRGSPSVVASRSNQVVGVHHVVALLAAELRDELARAGRTWRTASAPRRAASAVSYRKRRAIVARPVAARMVEQPGVEVAVRRAVVGERVGVAAVADEIGEQPVERLGVAELVLGERAHRDVLLEDRARCPSTRSPRSRCTNSSSAIDRSSTPRACVVRRRRCDSRGEGPSVDRLDRAVIRARLRLRGALTGRARPPACRASRSRRAS